MTRTNKPSTTKLLFTVLRIFVFVWTMLYADAFGSSHDESVSTNSIFLWVEDEKVGINPDNISIDVSTNESSSIISYVVQNGDTLESLSKEFGITVAELKKINKLSAEPAVGQKLIVSANEDGILYVVKESKTLKLFAEYYRLSLEDLITLNHFSDESEVVYAGQEIFINVTEKQAYDLGLLEKEQPVLPKDEVPVKKKVATQKTTSSTTATAARATAGTSNVAVAQTATTSTNKAQKQRYFNQKVSNGFAAGYCTWYAAHISPWMFDANGQRLFGGNAKDWYANAQNATAKAAGIKTSKTNPGVGAIVVYKSLRSYAGHVAVVKAYYPESGEMLVEDMNYVGKYIVTQRWDNVSNAKIIGYIYK